MTLHGLDTVVTMTRIHVGPAPRWNTIARDIIATLPKAFAAVPTIFSAWRPKEDALQALWQTRNSLLTRLSSFGAPRKHRTRPNRTLRRQSND